MATSWTFGGTALTSFGKVTLINSYLDMPTRRGQNQVIPFRHGSIYTPKYYSERSLMFGIAITAATSAALEATFDNMRKLFAVNSTQVLAMTMEDSTVRNAYATVDGEIQPSRVTGTFARVVVSFTLPSPFFRLSTAIADNTTTINASPKAMTVTNPGTVEERDATIILTGPLQNTVITNSTNGCTLTYTGTIASPRVVTISTSSTGEYVATDDLGVSVIGNVTHSGASALMVLNTGNNTMSITDATHTTGSVKITFHAPYL